MLLAYAYKENIKVVLFNATIKNNANVNNNKYNRNQILDNFNLPYNRLSLNKIIILTYQICRVALNL
jgi:hypothetical protein